MVKSRGKTRGGKRGRASSRGCGTVQRQSQSDSAPSGPPPQTSSQTFLSGFTRPCRLLLTQQDQVCSWMAERASTSMSQSTLTFSPATAAHSSPDASTSCPPSSPPLLISEPQLGFTEELFSHQFQFGAVEEEVETEIEGSESQRLHLSESFLGDGDHGPAAASQRDDETQLPANDVGWAPVEGVGEEEEGDDPVLDPDWVVDPKDLTEESNSEGGGEEPIAARGSDGPTVIKRPVPAVVERVRQSAVPQSTGRSSIAWKFFVENQNDKTHVTCTICKATISRGLNTNNLTTSTMLRHLKGKHDQHLLASRCTSQKRPHSAAAAAATGHATASCTVPPDLQKSQSSSSCSTQPSASMVQLSLAQTLERTRKFPKNSSQALKINGNISEMLALEMLPFQLVEAESFRKLMASAAPRYTVPSRHYFARHGMPALHDHVCKNINSALANAVTGTVHLTVDSWTSACGQGQYLSFTAHWVNVVEAGCESQPATSHILPTPRIAGPRSVTVSSSSYSSCSAPSTTSATSSTSWQRCSSAVGKRQQAILKLVDLTGKQHTGQELWRSIREQTESWLSPHNLSPGSVVCDNARNLAAALEIGRLTHVPCLAHVLNLIVQRFIKTYPCLPGLLVSVRRLCAHFRKSSVAASSLATLQRELHLPPHRLLCDVPTRWNSSLMMLVRVCEQRRAIVEYKLRYARTSSDRVPYFTSDEWALMSDLCVVLQVFEDCTKMVSGDNTIISLTIPLLMLLRRTLLQIKEEEETGQMEDSESSETLSRLRSLPSPQAAADEVAEDSIEEEEEEEDMPEEDAILGNETGRRAHSCPNIFLRRGWPEEGGVEEEVYGSPPDADNSILLQATLGHMADFMLCCVNQDPRVKRIFSDSKYWTCTLLDPRYRDKVSTLIAAEERESKMALYKGAIVSKLLRKFPSDNTRSRASTSAGMSSGQHSVVSGRSGTGRGRLLELWDSFVNPSGSTCIEEGGTLSRRAKFRKMVDEYMADRTVVLSDSSVPFNYWVAKLGTWQELALYALEVLACPAASVLSERVFSAAGGIITNRRSRLSTENADRLTCVKMNKGWIGPDFSSPPQ